MFSKLAVFAAATMAIFVAATPVPHDAPASYNYDYQQHCNTGDVVCCNDVQESSSAKASALTQLLGINLDNITGQVGLQCNPITAIGLGNGASCSAKPMCCTQNNFNGLIAMGCSPINLGF